MTRGNRNREMHRDDNGQRLSSRWRENFNLEAEKMTLKSFESEEKLIVLLLLLWHS